MPLSVESVNKIVVEIVDAFGFMKIQFCIKLMVSVLKSTKVCCWHHEHSVLVLYKVKSHFSENALGLLLTVGGFGKSTWNLGKKFEPPRHSGRGDIKYNLLSSAHLNYQTYA